MRAKPKNRDYAFYVSKKFDPNKEQFKNMWNLAVDWAEIKNGYDHRNYDDVKILFVELCCLPSKIPIVRKVIDENLPKPVIFKMNVTDKITGEIKTESSTIRVYKVQVNSVLGRLLQRMVNTFNSAAHDKMKKLAVMEKQLEEKFGVESFLEMTSTHLFFLSKKYGGRFYRYDIQ